MTENNKIVIKQKNKTYSFSWTVEAGFTDVRKVTTEDEVLLASSSILLVKCDFNEVRSAFPFLTQKNIGKLSKVLTD